MLTPIQRLIVSLYAGGDLSHVKSEQQADNCGDGLLAFLVYEMSDLDINDEGDCYELETRLETAARQLEALRRVLTARRFP